MSSAMTFEAGRFWRIGAGYQEDALQLPLSERPPFSVTGPVRAAERPYDVLAGPFGALVVSARLKDGLAERGFTGYSAMPIANSPFDLWVLVVHGRCGDPDDSQSPMRERTPGGLRHRQGYYFPIKTWSGHDFFRPEDRDAVFVVGRVREAVLGLGALEDLTRVRRPQPRG